METKKLQIAVIGSAGINDYQGQGGADTEMLDVAEQLGAELARNDCVVVTGGKDGIMESASKGAQENGGTTVGVIKGPERFTSNPYVDIEVVSGMNADGMDEMQIILMSDGIICVGGGAGTMQELALAYRNKKPIVIMKDSGGWASKVQKLKYFDERKRVQIQTADKPVEAVSMLLQTIK